MLNELTDVILARFALSYGKITINFVPQQTKNDAWKAVIFPRAFEHIPDLQEILKECESYKRPEFVGWFQEERLECVWLRPWMALGPPMGEEEEEEYGLENLPREVEAELRRYSRVVAAQVISLADQKSKEKEQLLAVLEDAVKCGSITESAFESAKAGLRLHRTFFYLVPSQIEKIPLPLRDEGLRIY